MTTFAALGDSITLGVGDPVRRDRTGRAWRGWAVLLAEGLPEPDLHILAANGACAADVERDQLPRALRLRPDVASVVFGVNDTLRPGFDPERIAAAAARTVGALRSAGAEVLTMRLPDPGWMLGLPGALARPLARRMNAINSAFDAIAGRLGTLHFDAAGDATIYDRRMWAADRLHPNERGHRLVARRFHDKLAAAGHPVGPAPGLEPQNPPPTPMAELAWLSTKGTGWVLRRSTDLVPYLLAMAAREIWTRPGADAVAAAGHGTSPEPASPGGPARAG
ncbi:MAG TPA: SGNH/GDSL hydrolase family protein [Streptosporangiaceae bacterium]|nr:SGNH/GDSL hydrolase family protein [Streptosporangiaceae bacterium]